METYLIACGPIRQINVLRLKLSCQRYIVAIKTRGQVRFELKMLCSRQGVMVFLCGVTAMRLINIFINLSAQRLFVRYWCLSICCHRKQRWHPHVTKSYFHFPGHISAIFHSYSFTPPNSLLALSVRLPLTKLPAIMIRINYRNN